MNYYLTTVSKSTCSGFHLLKRYDSAGDCYWWWLHFFSGRRCVRRQWVWAFGFLTDSLLLSAQVAGRVEDPSQDPVRDVEARPAAAAGRGPLRGAGHRPLRDGLRRHQRPRAMKPLLASLPYVRVLDCLCLCPSPVTTTHCCVSDRSAGC